MTEEFEKYISEALEKYEKERGYNKNKCEQKHTYLADFLISELKYTETLNDKELAAFKEYRHYVLRYISALKKEYFSAGFLYAACNESHINKKGQKIQFVD